MTLLGRLRDGLSRTAAQLGRRADTLEELQAVLLQADVGVAATDRIIERLQSGGRYESLRDELKSEIRRIFCEADSGQEGPPALRVVLVVGVNGSGKTTTVGKLAYMLSQTGGRPLICAADTFRAAANEQLAGWAERAEIEMIKARTGADPAALVFDAIQAARARGRDVLLVDTAGRLHTRLDLMAELGKMCRVVAREVEDGPHDVLLVLDATVGQNGLAQARQFLESAVVTGIVLTKLDGTARGGIAVAVAEELKIPIRYVGVGERVNDLLPFSIDEYVDGLFATGS